MKIEEPINNPENVPSEPELTPNQQQLWFQREIFWADFNAVLSPMIIVLTPMVLLVMLLGFIAAPRTSETAAPVAPVIDSDPAPYFITIPVNTAYRSTPENGSLACISTAYYVTGEPEIVSLIRGGKIVSSRDLTVNEAAKLSYPWSQMPNKEVTLKLKYQPEVDKNLLPKMGPLFLGEALEVDRNEYECLFREISFLSSDFNVFGRTNNLAVNMLGNPPAVGSMKKGELR